MRINYFQFKNNNNNNRELKSNNALEFLQFLCPIWNEKDNKLNFKKYQRFILKFKK